MNCNECKINLLSLEKEWMVMIKDDLWCKICKFQKELICDHCIEKRLGRKLTESDLLLPCQNYIDHYGLNEILVNVQYKFDHPEKFNLENPR